MVGIDDKALNTLIEDALIAEVERAVPPSRRRITISDVDQRAAEITEAES